MKKNAVLLAILILITALAACSSSLTAREKRVKEFLDANSNLDYNIKRQIMKEQISIGMTKKMVEASWGKPYFVEKVTDEGVQYENWVYTRDLARNYCCALPQVVKFTDGKVSGWIQRMKY